MEKKLFGVFPILKIPENRPSASGRRRALIAMGLFGLAGAGCVVGVSQPEGTGDGAMHISVGPAPTDTADPTETARSNEELMARIYRLLDIDIYANHVRNHRERIYQRVYPMKEDAQAAQWGKKIDIGVWTDNSGERTWFGSDGNGQLVVLPAVNERPPQRQLLPVDVRNHLEIDLADGRNAVIVAYGVDDVNKVFPDPQVAVDFMKEYATVSGATNFILHLNATGMPLPESALFAGADVGFAPDFRSGSSSHDMINLAQVENPIRRTDIHLDLAGAYGDAQAAGLRTDTILSGLLAKESALIVADEMYALHANPGISDIPNDSYGSFVQAGAYLDPKIRRIFTGGNANNAFISQLARFTESIQ